MSAWIYFVGIIGLTIAMMVVSFPVGIYTVFGGHLSDNYTASTPVNALTYDFSFGSVQLPVDSNLGGVFFGFLVIYAGFLLLAARQGAGLSRALRGVASNGYLALFSNPLAALTVILGATTLMTTVLDTVQSNAGVQTGSLSGDPLALLVNFTIAPLLEESTFRLIMLGVPVLLLGLLIMRDFSPMKAARALWRPSSAWDVDEVEGEEIPRSFELHDPSIFPGASSGSLKARAMRPIVYVFLALSSVSFGYAHYASGSGWGPGKISEAALAGIALGYLYIKYGFHTNVLLHWSIDYVGSVFSFLAQAVWGVPWTSDVGNPLDYIPNVVIIFLLGVPSVLLVANELMKGAMAKGFKEKAT